MTDPAPRHRRATRWLLTLLAATVLLAGCELATGTVRTATELQRAGIDNPNLNYNNGVARLDYDPDPDPLEARTEQDRAAGIIWRNLPFRIERITVVASGGGFPGRRDYPRVLLEQQFGPRPARLDRSVSDIARRASLIAVAVGLVLLVLIVVVVVLVVRAVRARPAPQPAGPWPQAPAGAQPWGQPAWGQPAPPGQPPPPAQQPWAQSPPPAQQPWGGQPPAPPAAPPPAAPPPPGPPTRGPGDTQRLEPGPPAGEDRGPVPPS